MSLVLKLQNTLPTFFLATKISFINEIANFCETKGVNVDLVSLGIDLDHRIGPYFLQAGIGYGGSCFPKDVAAMLAFGQEIGYHFKILEAVKTVNQHQRELLISKVLAIFKQDLANKVLSVWGLAFKANTDDIRDSPAVAIVTELYNYSALEFFITSKSISSYKFGIQVFCYSIFSLLFNDFSFFLATSLYYF